MSTAYTSKFTKRLLAQTKAQQQHSNPAPSKPAPGEGYRAAVNPAGTAFPEGRLPVRHHASPVPGADPSALPAIDDVDEEMQPHHPSAVKPADDNAVVRTASSPLLYQPAATKQSRTVGGTGRSGSTRTRGVHRKTRKQCILQW